MNSWQGHSSSLGPNPEPSRAARTFTLAQRPRKRQLGRHRSPALAVEGGPLLNRA
jgi:hypothetical protein